MFNKFHLRMNIFTAVKYCCILHGRFIVMKCVDVQTDLSLYCCHIAKTGFLTMCLKYMLDGTANISRFPSKYVNML